jgi:hypothetical protein
VQVILLHGATGFLDEFIELGLPLLIFGGLYWWSTRKEKRKKKEAAVKKAALAGDGAAGRGEK